MKITAVITTFNRPDKLIKAVASVENQTRLPDELIIIDDNSDEETQKFCRNLTAKFPVIYFHNDKNMGACFCRNQAIERTRGDYIAFLDDDDEWLPKKLQIQYETAVNENADLIYTAVQTINNKNNAKKYFHKKTPFLPAKIAILLLNYPGSTSSLMFKSKFLRSIGGFDSKLPALQDYEISMRAIRNGAKVVGIDKVLVNYGTANKYSIVSSSKKFFEASKILLKRCPKRYLPFKFIGLFRSFLSRLKFKSFRESLFAKNQ